MMFNITSHQGNAEKNHNETSSLTCKNGYHQNTHTHTHTHTHTQITSAGEDMEKKERLCTISGNLSWSSQCGKRVQRFF